MRFLTLALYLVEEQLRVGGYKRWALRLLKREACSRYVSAGAAILFTAAFSFPELRPAQRPRCLAHAPYALALGAAHSIDESCNGSHMFTLVLQVIKDTIE